MIAGIAVDDYKVLYFRQQLEKKGYKVIDSKLLFGTTYLIRVEYESAQAQALAYFIKTLNTNFRRN